MVKIGQTKFLMILVGVVLVLSVVNLYGTFNLRGKLESVTGMVVTAQPSDQPSVPSAPSVRQVSVGNSPVMGSNDAPVTIVEFSDFQCPYCAAAVGIENVVYGNLKQRDPTWEPALPRVISEYVKTGKARLVFRNFPLGGHQYAEKAAEAAECANEQGKFWEYHDKLFAKQDALDVASLKQYAKDLNLKEADFSSCLDSGKMASEVQKDLADGQSYEVDGTPIFFVNGVELIGAQPFAAFQQVIEEQLKK